MGLKMGAGSSTAGAGELQVISIIASSAPGLSPLARGTRGVDHCWTVAIRFIPAGAGNTSSIFVAIADISVYPRWRGEHRAASASSSFSVGLSPLARGTH